MAYSLLNTVKFSQKYLCVGGLGVRNVPKQIESKSVLENPGNFSG